MDSGLWTHLGRLDLLGLPSLANLPLDSNVTLLVFVYSPRLDASIFDDDRGWIQDTS